MNESNDGQTVEITHDATGITNETSSFTINTVLEEIEVTEDPTLTYDSGETLDLSGMEVAEHYTDGSVETETFTDGTHSNYTTDPPNGAVLNESNDGQTVEITHKASGITNGTDSLTINPILESIGIKTQPTLEYLSGEELDLRDMEIKEYYSDGTEKIVEFTGGTHENYTVDPSNETVIKADHHGDTINVTHETADMSIETDELTVIHELSLDVQGNGTVSAAPSEGTYEHGTEVTVEATADEGWSFDSWTGDVPGDEEGTEITITMDADKDITAVFEQVEKVEYELTIDIMGEGTTDPSEGTHSYEEGTTLTIEAESDEGYEFINWTGDYSSEKKSIDIAMEENMSVTANFLQKPRFEVMITDYDEDITEDDEVVVNYTVTNEGELEDTETVKFKVNSTVVDEIELTLSDGEGYEGGFNWTAEDPAENITLSIQSEDDSVEETVGIEPLLAEFELSNLRVNPEGPEAGEEIELKTDVSNVGDAAANYTVEFFLDDTKIGSDTVEVNGGETETASITYTVDEAVEHELEAGDKTTSFSVKESGSSNNNNDDSSDSLISMNYLYLGGGGLFLIILLILLAKRGGSSTDEIEDSDLEEDKTADKDKNSENYDLSEEDEDDIDLYGT